MSVAKSRNISGFGEKELVSRAQAREEEAIRAIIKQHNRRLFRIARSVLRDDFEAEDAVQDAYLKAFAMIGSFRGESSLGTWLSRIVLNEGLQRLRGKRGKPQLSVELDAESEAQIIPFPNVSPHLDPEKSMAQRELVRLVEKAVDSLPDEFRLVLVARTIEGMTIEETAELLELRPETVKTRLHRARKLLKESMAQHLDPVMMGAFPFLGRRCDGMADRVIARMGLK